MEKENMEKCRNCKFNTLSQEKYDKLMKAIKDAKWEARKVRIDMYNSGGHGGGCLG